jgi:N-acetylmuramoyl-L-alanine amidase
MSIFSRAANFAAMTICAVVVVGGIPAGTASGAMFYPSPRETNRLPMVPTMGPPSVLGGSVIDDNSDIAPLVLPTIEVQPASLSALVDAYSGDEAASGELNCLASAVYFESKGEPLAGQLAVAKVIMNRSQSGRFAPTICGVVKQPSQFSFVRGGGFPAVRSDTMWRKAVGVAQVAMKGLFASPAPDALYFHAKRVSPRWNKHQVASVGNHLFYR